MPAGKRPFALASRRFALLIFLVGGHHVVAAVPPGDTKSGEAALKALRAELSAAGRVWVARYRQARSDDERDALNRKSPYRLFEPRFLELARRYAGEPAAMEALRWLVDSANPGPVFDEGLKLIEKHHIPDPGLAKLCRTLAVRRTPGVEQFLLGVAKKHPRREIRGLAYLCLARYLKSLGDTAKYVSRNEKAWLKSARKIYSREIVAWIRGFDSTRLSARVDRACETVIRDFAGVGDSEYQRTTGKQRSLADAARAVQFSLHAVGSLAPNFAGATSDGSRVVLKDLRGKVVVLMFSANWCGPCKIVYGQLREMMELYAKKPFTVLTVMADRRLRTVKAAVDSGEITWPAVWDGADGPIAGAWHITAYPTIYLIDKDGRIKSDGLRDDALDDKVAEMLGISPASRVKIDKRKRRWRLSLREQKIVNQELPKRLAGYTEIRSLDLSHNPLADEALLHLRPLHELRIIRLEHTGITDKGLRYLERVPTLKAVYLYLGPWHRTTKAGRRSLRRAIPGLKMSIITN